MKRVAAGWRQVFCAMCVVVAGPACSRSGGNLPEDAGGLEWNLDVEPREIPRGSAGETPADPEPPPDAIHAVLAEGETSTETVHMSADIRAADVVFLIDTTGSMGEEIEALRADFASIAATLAGIVPDVAFGVANYHDYAIAPAGGVQDYPFRLDQQITTDHPRIPQALDTLFASGGGDFPESQYEALFQLATGRGFDLQGDGAVQVQDVPPFVADPADAFGGLATGSYDPALPGASPTGGMGFREGVFRIVVHASDAKFRDPDTDTSLEFPGTRPRGKSEATAALRDIGAHVIGVASGTSAVDPMIEMAIATGAVADPDDDGMADDPLVYAVDGDAGGLADAVSDGIVNMLTTSELEISAAAAGDDWGFVAEVSPHGAGTVKPGEVTTFDVTLVGTIPPAAEDRTFEFSIRLVAKDGTLLDERPAVVVVPGTGT